MRKECAGAGALAPLPCILPALHSPTYSAPSAHRKLTAPPRAAHHTGSLVQNIDRMGNGICRQIGPPDPCSKPSAEMVHSPFASISSGQKQFPECKTCEDE